MFRKTFSLVLLSALLAVMAGSAHASLAPLSPEFLKWREEQRNAVHTAGETAAARNYGVRPSPLNLAHLATNPVKVANALPVSFDLRTLDVVPPVRDQSEWRTCWAFATMSAVETNYLMQVKEQGTDQYITKAIPAVGSTSADVDLSEMHLAWFTFMGPKLGQRFTNTAAKNLSATTQGSAVLSVGAYPDIPASVMARGKGWGPVTEEELSYIGETITMEKIKNDLGKNATDEQIEKELNSRTDKYCEENLSGKEPSDYPSVLRLKEAAYVVTMSNEDDEGAALLFKQSRDAVKQLVMGKGALYVSYFAGGEITNSSYYYSGEDGSHAVALIGWDDDYPAANFTADKFGKKPSKNGAWLIRNSWGTDKDFPDGCFWMSYEQNVSFGTAFSMAQADDSLTTYTHSDLGWALSWGMGDEGDKVFYGANVFKAGSQEVKLEEIGFYTTDNNAEAEFSVYVSDEKPTASTLTVGRTPAATQTVSGIPYAGFHTVTLDSPVPVKAGQYLTIVQKAVNPSYNYPLAVTARINNWSDFAEFYDGEGYVSSNGTEWTDGIQTVENGKSKPIIPCLYAYVSGAAEDDECRDGGSLTIDGIPVENLEDFARDLNVDFDVNEKLNPDIPAGRVFNLTLGGVDGSAVKAGETYTVYLLYTNDVLHWEEQAASDSGVRYPSGDIVPEYPTGYKPDMFLTVKVTDEASLRADLPAYGPFEVTTAAGGKITLNVNNLIYADGYESEKVGERAKIPAGYHNLLYFSQTDTETSACGMVEDLNVTAGGKSGGSSSSGCDLGLGGWLALGLAGLAVFLRKQ